MTESSLDRILARLADAKQNARGWQARCPAHDDRGPSLSVGIGRDGAVLLRCFAGCDAGSIAAALGLGLRDLFPSRDTERREGAAVARLRSAYRASPRTTIVAFLKAEIDRQRALRLQRYAYDTPEIRSADVNAARRRAALMFEIELAPIARYAWEGYDPHDRDPEWPLLFARALEELAWELHHFRQPYAAAWETCEPPAILHPLAADRAAGWLRGRPTAKARGRAA